MLINRRSLVLGSEMIQLGLQAKRRVFLAPLSVFCGLISLRLFSVLRLLVSVSIFTAILIVTAIEKVGQIGRNSRLLLVRGFLFFNRLIVILRFSWLLQKTECTVFPSSCISIISLSPISAIFSYPSIILLCDKVWLLEKVEKRIG